MKDKMIWFPLGTGEQGPGPMKSFYKKHVFMYNRYNQLYPENVSLCSSYSLVSD